jgi:hypothetical protein
MMRRFDPVVLIAAAVGVAGLVLLFRGLADGVPLVYWGTKEERVAREVGRARILAAGIMLVAAGAVLAVRRSLVYGVAVAAVGPFTAALTFAVPETAWPWLAFLLLSPVALGAWIAAVTFPPVGGRERR